MIFLLVFLMQISKWNNNKWKLTQMKRKYGKQTNAEFLFEFSLDEMQQLNMQMI